MISGSDILPADFNASFARTIAVWRENGEEKILHIDLGIDNPEHPFVGCREVLSDEAGSIGIARDIPLAELELVRAYPESPAIVNLTNKHGAVYTAKYNRSAGRNRHRAMLVGDMVYDFPMSLLQRTTEVDYYRIAHRLYAPVLNHATLDEGLYYLRKSKLLSIALSNSVTLVYTNKKRAEILVEEYQVGFVNDQGGIVLQDASAAWILDLPTVRSFYTAFILEEVQSPNQEQAPPIAEQVINVGAARVAGAINAGDPFWVEARQVINRWAPNGEVVAAQEPPIVPDNLQPARNRRA